MVCLLLNDVALANYDLTNLIQHTLKTHPQTQADAFAKKSALKAIDSARYDYYPTLDLSVKRVDANQSDVNYSEDDDVVILNLTQALYAGGAIDANLDKAQADLALKTAVAQQQKFELLTSVVKLFADYRQKFYQYQHYQENYATYLSVQKRIKNRATIGFSAKADHNLVLEKLDKFKYQMQETKLDLENALMQLAIKTRLDLTQHNLVLKTKNFYFEKMNFDDFSENHHQLLQIQAKLADAKAQVKQNQAKLLPKINLRFEHQKGNFSSQNFDTENRVFLELFMQFSLGLPSDVDLTKFNKMTILYELKALNQTIRQEFKLKSSIAQSLKEKIKIVHQRILQLEKILSSKNRLFSAGRISWQDFLASTDELIAIKNQLASLNSQSLVLDYYFAGILGRL